MRNKVFYYEKVFYYDVGYIAKGNFYSSFKGAIKDGEYVWERHFPKYSLKDAIGIAKVLGNSLSAKAGILVAHFEDKTQKVYFFKNRRRDKILQLQYERGIR